MSALPKNIRILAIDPAITDCGWSVIDYKPKTGILNVYRFGTIQSSKTVSRADYREEVNQFGKRMISLNFLEDRMDELIATHSPQYIVIESSFFNSRFPNACIALTQCIYAIERLAYRKYQMPVYREAPKAAKLAISGSGDAKKENVQDAVLTHDRVNFKQKRQTYKLTEHAADSIGIAMAFIQNILPSLMGTA